MKIQCDVCGKEEATIFCTADEAALCQNCDSRVHSANKLARKHLRFSLLYPQVNECPLCDICQERRALLFCQEDRALLCRDCDGPIHKANEHTKKHNRFFLTGVKLAPAEMKKDSADNSIQSNNCSESSSNPLKDNSLSQLGSDTASSISEYLMETLPGWHVDDFLDPSSSYNLR